MVTGVETASLVLAALPLVISGEPNHVNIRCHLLLTLVVACSISAL